MMDSDSKSGLPFRPRDTSTEGGISESAKETSMTPQDLNHPKSPKSVKQDSKSKKEQPRSKGQPNEKSGNAATKANMASASTTTELPEYIIQRNELFDKLKHEHDAAVLEMEHPAINVTLDLGLDKEGKPRPIMPVAAKAWESTPGSFLRHVDKDVSSDVVIAKVDGKLLWDLDRPLEYACQVSYLPFTSAEGRNVFWHSSAHVLGEAAECQYQCLLSHGPPVEQGFFYDMALPEGWACLILRVLCVY